MRTSFLQFFSSHPVSDIDKAALNPGNCIVVRSTLSSQLKVKCTVEYHQHIEGIPYHICHRIMSPSGVVYKRYERPNTDSWGTPNLSVRTEEVNQSELPGNDPY